MSLMWFRCPICGTQMQGDPRNPPICPNSANHPSISGQLPQTPQMMSGQLPQPSGELPTQPGISGGLSSSQPSGTVLPPTPPPLEQDPVLESQEPTEAQLPLPSPSQPIFARSNQPSGQLPPPGLPPMQPAYNTKPSVWKRRVSLPLWAFVTIILIVCIVGSAIGAAQGNSASTGSQASASTATPAPTNTPGPTPTPGPTNTPAPTATPTHVPQWTTIQTFKGNGNKKTPDFTVPDSWKIVWDCNPSSFGLGQYNLIVDVYNADGSFNDLGAINTICQKGNIHDETQEHGGGSVYLDVQSEGAWTIQIQVLQ
jgi:hypothetical protein